MALDLVSLITQYLSPQLVSGLARATGINELIAQRLVSAAIPTILGALGTTAAAPGGAQKLVDAVSNSDPDLLTKLASSIGGGNVGALTDGANLLGGLLGGSGLSSLVGALGQFAGAPHVAAQSAIGAVAQAAIGTIGQQDPSNWSDPSSLTALFNSQKNAITAALPPELSKALGATGLLAGLGGLGATAAQTASAATSAAASASSAAAARVEQAAATTAGGFPTWAIVLIALVVLLALWWFFTHNQTPEPAKTGMLPAPIELALQDWRGPGT